MTHEMLLRATSHAELATMLAPLSGREVRALLEQRGMPWATRGPVTRQRAALAEWYGRRLDSFAIARLGR
jgi:hypothetical protein